MNILIISLDKGLLGQGQLGDVCERHKEYGKRVDSIDIIVFSKSGYSPYVISENVSAFPTNSRTQNLSSFFSNFGSSSEFSKILSPSSLRSNRLKMLFQSETEDVGVANNFGNRFSLLFITDDKFPIR